MKKSSTDTQLYPYIILGYYAPERQKRPSDTSTYCILRQQSLCSGINTFDIYDCYGIVLPTLKLTSP